MILKASATIPGRTKFVRALLAVLGLLLLVDALVLMCLGHFNVGVVLPAGLGAAALGLSWKWQAVQHWRAARALHARLWFAPLMSLRGWRCYCRGLFCSWYPCKPHLSVRVPRFGRTGAG